MGAGDDTSDIAPHCPNCFRSCVRMAALELVVLIVCGFAFSFAKVPLNVPPKTTIFSDERLEGEPFEKEYIFQELEAGARNTLSPSDYRLPTTTRPTDYDILWDINIDNLTFSGTVGINLVATQANVNQIVLHANDLNIESVVLQQGSTIVPQSYELQKETHFMRITLSSGVLAFNAINPVVYRLTITFSADLREDMYGIYKTWFVNDPSSTTVSWMASTQFQPTSARQAFPCYDEPSFKATFDITIRRPVNYKSWSCTLQKETRNTNNPLYQEDVYHTTPIMSTYLLALIVAEYDSLDHIENNTLKYEVIARPSAIAQGQGQYAFDVGQLLLANMSEHTGIDFYDQHPYLKMTQASIPDFGAGAMENWGLLTYREAYLMYDPNHTNDYYKQIIAYILSHEIAHMWFGNWVTNEWWDVLWLNEGFARYYQYFLTHWVERDMGFETRFIIEQVHVVLLTDSSNNPQPLTNPNVGSPGSVSAMFSTISYNKGAAVIRMTEHLLGFEVHREGLRNYLINRALDVALPIHLFQELQNVAEASGAIAQYGSDFSVIDYYKSWTEQRGHPVLNVYVDHKTGKMTITQRRFNINTGYTAINNLWIIPITFATASNPDFENTKPTHILSKAVTVIDRGSTGDQWVIFNKQQTGYYRVNYDDYTWDLIAIALRGPNRTQIHEYNRAQIVNDVFQFARSGLMTYTRALNIISFLEQETAYAPWVAAMTGFTWLRNRFAGTILLTKLQTLIARWSTRVMSELTYYPRPSDTFMDSYLRWNLAPILCQINVAECRIAANAQFRELRVNGTEVTVNSRNWVYCNGLREGTTEDFDFLFERFRLHPVYTEKIQLLSVLGCTPHAASINKFMDAIVNDNYLIRPQDYSTALNSAVNGNEENTQLVFNYVKANLANVTAGLGSAGRALNSVASRLRNPTQIFEFQTWVNQTREQLGAEYQSIYNSAESTRASLLWAAQVQDDISNYIDQGGEVLTSSTPPTIVVTNPSTVARPDIFEPVTPDFSSSAVSSILSFTSLIVALVANFAF